MNEINKIFTLSADKLVLRFYAWATDFQVLYNEEIGDAAYFTAMVGHQVTVYVSCLRNPSHYFSLFILKSSSLIGIFRIFIYDDFLCF